MFLRPDTKGLHQTFLYVPLNQNRCDRQDPKVPSFQMDNQTQNLSFVLNSEHDLLLQLQDHEDVLF